MSRMRIGCRRRLQGYIAGIVIEGMPRGALIALFVVCLQTFTSSTVQTALPKVMVIATGGTIAGEQKEPGTLGAYEIRKPVNEIVSLVPEVQKYAHVDTEQFLNIPST